MPSSFVHDPNAVLDYYIDWTAWLAGDTLVTSTWANDQAAGVTLNADAIVGGVTVIWVAVALLAGLQVGVTNHVTTAAGREDDRTFWLSLEER